MPRPISEIIERYKTEPGIPVLWERFGEISAIPRSSGFEQATREYLRRFAADRNFRYEIDDAGNILIEIPATPGEENKPGVILQAHMDMVCVHDEGFPDPAVEGVKPLVDDSGQWVYAAGTSLGADNAIGLAIALSLADDKDSEHGPLKILATVAEETGMTGALKIAFKNLDTSKDKFLINLDSEIFEEVYVGCAGGGDSLIDLPVKREPIENRSLIKLKLAGLSGGHSGMVIGEKHLNAIKELAGMLHELQKDVPFQIVSFEAGTRRNVVPSEGEFVVAVDPYRTREFSEKIELHRETLRIKAADIEKREITVEHSQVFQSETFAMTGEATSKLLQLLSKLPHGVRRWSENIAGLPHTSTNLATITTETETVKISMMTRSPVGAELSELRTEIKTISEEHGALVEHPDDYPGWNLDLSSRLLAIIKTEYLELVGQAPKISATHCGLECGAIAGNPFFGNLDAISIGPTILEPHSTRERVDIDSVAATYRLVKNILKKIIR